MPPDPVLPDTILPDPVLPDPVPPAPVLPDFPLPGAADRAHWEGLPADVRARLLARGATARAEPWAQPLLRDWMGYAATGDRAGFEALYLARRRKLNALVMAECAEGKGGFLPDIADGCMLLCEESGWQLPAHNAHVRGGARLPLPDPEAPVVDLYAAETAALLAVVAALLGPALDRAAPGIVARLDVEIGRRVLHPYLTRRFWWMGAEDGPTNNWTAWCTQNVLLTAFLRPVGDRTRRAVLARAAPGLDAFLDGYGADGACAEGAQYYRHAALCLWGALHILTAVAPAAFGPLWSAPKLRDMAEFLVRMHVAGPRHFNFGDCAALLEPCGAREFLFGRAVGSALLAGHAARDAAADPAPDLPGEWNLWYRVLAAQTAAAIRAWDRPPEPQGDHWYPSIGLLVARDGDWALAVKAGSNGDGHNHNDVGSFTLCRGGRPVLIDLGVESYTARTFSARRYEIWTMQSAWHNLPTFGGVQQRDGARFAARDVTVALAPEAATLAMEIAGAWPPEARLRSYRRRVCLRKGRGVTLEDLHDGDLPAELSLMLAERPVLSEGRIELPRLATIALEGAGTMALDEVPVLDETLRRSWPDRVWRVRVPLAGRRLGLRIS